jgi:hypothetical protein
MKIYFLLYFLILGLVGCETMRGVSSSKDPFVLISDKSCVKQAIASVKDVQYVESFTKNEENKSWKNEPIYVKIDYFIYKIPELANLNISSQPGKKPLSEIMIIEKKSENPKYNSISYYNTFGHLNGRDYRTADKDRAKEIVKKIDETVIKQCKLDLSIPEPKEE